MGSQAALTPYADEWLEVEAKMGSRFLLRGSALEQRAQFNAVGEATAPLLPPLPDVLDVEDVTASNNLRVRVYSPKEGKGDLPFGVYYHCGGFVMGSIESDDYFCRIIAMSTPCVIVSVDYRLAPEHKYPAAHDDAKTTYTWACENISKYGGSPSKGFTIGQSAGANLAVSTALALNQQGQHKVNGVAAISSVTCAPSAIPSHLRGDFKPEENADSAVIDAAGMDVYLTTYDPPHDDPAYSVLLSPQLATLPPTYLVATGKDPLRDDVRVFEKVAREAGASTKLDFYEGYPHLFWITPGVKKAEEAIGNIVAGVQWVISKF